MSSVQLEESKTGNGKPAKIDVQNLDMLEQSDVDTMNQLTSEAEEEPLNVATINQTRAMYIKTNIELSIQNQSAYLISKDLKREGLKDSEYPDTLERVMIQVRKLQENKRKLVTTLTK